MTNTASNRWRPFQVEGEFFFPGCFRISPSPCSFRYSLSSFENYCAPGALSSWPPTGEGQFQNKNEFGCERHEHHAGFGSISRVMDALGCPRHPTTSSTNLTRQLRSGCVDIWQLSTQGDENTSVTRQGDALPSILAPISPSCPARQASSERHCFHPPFDPTTIIGPPPVIDLSGGEKSYSMTRHSAARCKAAKPWIAANDSENTRHPSQQCPAHERTRRTGRSSPAGPSAGVLAAACRIKLRVLRMTRRDSLNQAVAPFKDSRGPRIFFPADGLGNECLVRALPS